MIHVLAILTANPGQRRRAMAEIQAVTAQVHAEEGCIAYQVTVDSAESGPNHARFGDDTFVVVEKWQDIAALTAHTQSDHMAECGARLNGLLAKREVHVLSPADEA